MTATNTAVARARERHQRRVREEERDRVSAGRDNVEWVDATLGDPVWINADGSTSPIVPASAAAAKCSHDRP